MSSRSSILFGAGLLAFSPAALSAQLLEGPAVDADRKVTFRIKAPEAQRVLVDPLDGALASEKGPYPLARGEDGVWTATIGPARPGFHYYALVQHPAEKGSI